MKLTPPLSILFVLTVFAGAAGAQTDVCEGLTGNAHGLCTAYCEAMDCDSESPNASGRACERVMMNFEELTGLTLPCDNFVCPCIDLSADFDNIVTDPTNQSIQSCTITTFLSDPNDILIEIIAVASTAGADIAGAMYSCSASDIGTNMFCTLQEATACVQDLEDAAAVAGVPCSCTGPYC